MRWRVPENMWKGGDVFIIGGGPSVPHQFNVPQHVINDVLEGRQPPSAYSPYMKSIHNKKVIGVNAAFLLGGWINLMFFGDLDFFKKYSEKIAEFPGIVVTCQAKFKRPDIKWIKALDKSRYSTGICNDLSAVSWNGNSGAASINIAAHAGASRIILLGFDMKQDNNKQWWHNLYAKGGESKMKNLPFERHKRCFKKIKEDADARGIEIINACPDSTIVEFEKKPLNELL